MAQTDQSCLFYLLTHQEDLRADVYQGVVDAVLADGDADIKKLGQQIILPSSYIGGSWHMFQLYQDLIALSGFFGRQDFFLTMTANPKWDEIT